MPQNTSFYPLRNKPGVLNAVFEGGNIEQTGGLMRKKVFPGKKKYISRQKMLFFRKSLQLFHGLFFAVSQHQKKKRE